MPIDTFEECRAGRAQRLRLVIETLVLFNSLRLLYEVLVAIQVKRMNLSLVGDDVYLRAYNGAILAAYAVCIPLGTVLFGVLVLWEPLISSFIAKCFHSVFEGKQSE